MEINPNIFRGYDLRGLVEKDLNPDIVVHLGKVYGTYLVSKKQFTAIIARDFRESSPAYSKAIIEGLNWAGIDTIDIGLNLVGTFYWAAYHLKNPAGVYVSASHNPAEYNGFKFMNGYSETLVQEGMQELLKMFQNDSIQKGKKQGANSEKNIIEEYYKDIISRVHISKKFKVVVDAGAATAGVFAPELLRRTGCDVIESNTTLDPTFPLGTVDPTEVTVQKRLAKKVVKVGADVGFSYDTDGDRIGIVDEKGGIIWNDILVAMFAEGALTDHPDSIIMYNTLCSKVVNDTVRLHGGKPFMWRTGHSFLKKKNQEIGAVFIGELSGHFFFSKDFYNHDDGLFSTLRALRYIEEKNMKLSEIVASLPTYHSSPEIKIHCSDDKKVELIKKISPLLKKDFPDAEVIEDERAGDGLRLEMDHGMFVIRYSQNGPYITIKFESKTKDEYEKFRIYIKKLLQSFEEVEWEKKNNVNMEALVNPS